MIRLIFNIRQCQIKYTYTHTNTDPHHNQKKKYKPCITVSVNSNKTSKIFEWLRKIQHYIHDILNNYDSFIV